METEQFRTHSEELVPLKEGARRHGVAYDAALKRVNAGTLPAEKRGGRWFVWAPKVERLPFVKTGSPETKAEDSVSETEQNGTQKDTMIVRLESEVSFLRAELAGRAEETRRLHHLLAGALERMPELSATIGTSPQDAHTAPVRNDAATKASETQLRAQDAQESTWRRWWRRITGH